VERALVPDGWASLAKEMACIPGGCREVSQREGGGGGKEEDADAAGNRKVVLVCYVGGVTHAEISSLRFLSEHSAWIKGGRAPALSPARARATGEKRSRTFFNFPPSRRPVRLCHPRNQRH
jgi:hypothetical protein